MAALHPRATEHLTRMGLLSQVTVVDDKNASIAGNVSWPQMQELERNVAQHGASLQLVGGVLRIVQL